MTVSKLKNHYKPWHISEDKFLRKNYDTYTNNQLAAALGRSYASVTVRARHLGLKRTKASIYKPRNNEKKRIIDWREETSCTAVCICSAVIRGEKLGSIANDLNRPYEQVKYIYDRSLYDGTYRRVYRFQKSDFVPRCGYDIERRCSAAECPSDDE